VVNVQIICLKTGEEKGNDLMIYHTHIGRFELASLQVWPLQQIPVQEVLTGTDAQSLERARLLQPQFFGADATLVELTQNICVIRNSEQIVLVDTSEPLKRAGAILQWGLASLGIEPQHIDVVFLSHRDTDHVGGCVDLADNPFYPNAKYLMSRLEYESFKSDVQRIQGFQMYIEPLEKRGQLELFEGGAEIAKGLTTVPTPGHRPGATSLRIQDGDQAALLLVDTLHLPMQITHPEWSSVWDSDKDIAATTRRRIIEQAERERLLLAVPHTPFGGLGYVRLEEGRSVWSSLS
jgi:glyoxylase-like metal-dependent hydrolase (beta-lactamase superfamily II)